MQDPGLQITVSMFCKRVKRWSSRKKKSWYATILRINSRNVCV